MTSPPTWAAGGAAPHTGAIPVNGLMDVWVVGEIPAAAADGAYDLTFTAVGEGPGNQGTAVHLLWVGDWVAPPPPTTGDGHQLFLPAVVKP